MKIVLTAALFFLTCSVLAQETPPSDSKNSYNIREESKSIEDGKMTFVNLERILIESSDAPSAPVELKASFAFITKDNKSVVWPLVTLAFTSRAAKSRFPDRPNVTFLLDGKLIKIRGVEAAERGGEIATSFAEPGVEWLDISISTNTFIAIADAKSVEMQVGQLRLRFQDEHMKALRELAKRMTSLQAQHNNPMNRIRN